MNTFRYKAVVSPYLKATNGGLLKDGKAITDAIAGFPLIFNNMNPKPADALPVLTAFDRAITRAVSGTKADRKSRNKQRKLVELILKQWAAQVTLAANGDAEIIARSKFHASKPRTVITEMDTPATPVIKDGTETGSVNGKTKRVKNGRSFQFRSSTKDPGTATEADYTYYTSASVETLMTGLTPGVYYFFSCRAIGSRCKSSWSNARLFMVR